jgi:hypothetical protein
MSLWFVRDALQLGSAPHTSSASTCSGPRAVVLADPHAYTGNLDDTHHHSTYVFQARTRESTPLLCVYRVQIRILMLSKPESKDMPVSDLP